MLTPEDERSLQKLREAAARIDALEATLTPAELAAVQAEWARFHAKVASGALAVPLGQETPYAETKRLMQEHRRSGPEGEPTP